MHDPLLCSFTKPIQDFYKVFSELQIVQTAIREEFGDSADLIIEALRAGHTLGDREDEVYYLIYDLIKSESGEADKIAAMGEFEFDIRINEFGSSYWVSAIEFDDVGLFTSIKDAKRFACENYSSFIEAMNESVEE